MSRKRGKLITQPRLTTSAELSRSFGCEAKYRSLACVKHFDSVGNWDWTTIAANWNTLASRWSCAACVVSRATAEHRASRADSTSLAVIAAASVATRIDDFRHRDFTVKRRRFFHCFATFVLRDPHWLAVGTHTRLRIAENRKSACSTALEQLPRKH